MRCNTYDKFELFADGDSQGFVGNDVVVVIRAMGTRFKSYLNTWCFSCLKHMVWVRAWLWMWMCVSEDVSMCLVRVCIQEAM